MNLPHALKSVILHFLAGKKPASESICLRLKSRPFSCWQKNECFQERKEFPSIFITQLTLKSGWVNKALIQALGYIASLSQHL